MNGEWLALFINVVIALVDKGILSKDKLPKDFPKNNEELESFILKVTLNNADKILEEVTDTIEQWED